MKVKAIDKCLAHICLVENLHLKYGKNSQDFKKKISKPIFKWVRDVRIHFIKEDALTNKHVKRGSTSLSTKELQYKSTMG